MSVRVRVVGVFAAEVCRSPAHGCARLLARLLRSCTWKGQVRLLGLLVALVASVSTETAWAQQSPPAPNSASPPATPGAAPPTSTTPSATTPYTLLPPVVVVAPSEPEKKTKPHKAAKANGTSLPDGPAPGAAPGAAVAAAALASPIAVETKALDEARDHLLTQIGTNAYSMSQQTLEALPEGTNAPVSKVLLQAPGVTQDSVASGQIHVRNEHANVQFRINGIILPDGVAGFSQVLDTAFIGNMALVTGALPAEYGLRTSGLIDIQTRSGAFNNGGSISVYGGSRETLTPSFEYGGTEGQTEYFVTARYFQSNEGIENPTSSVVPIHDNTEQGGFFSYVSTLLNPNTRLSWISGCTINQFQIPNSPNQDPAFTPFGIQTFNSAALNERQFEQNYYNVVALQQKSDAVDWQIAYFARSAISTSRPMSWAISSSTESPPTYSARAWSMVSKVMVRTRWTQCTPCGPAFS